MTNAATCSGNGSTAAAGSDVIVGGDGKVSGDAVCKDGVSSADKAKPKQPEKPAPQTNAAAQLSKENICQAGASTYQQNRRILPDKVLFQQCIAAAEDAVRTLHAQCSQKAETSTRLGPNRTASYENPLDYEKCMNTGIPSLSKAKTVRTPH